MLLKALQLLLLCSVLAGCGSKWEDNDSTSDAMYLINTGKYQEAAAKLERLSANSSSAAFLLGELHATGRGFQSNREVANHWFMLSDKLAGVRGKAAYDMAWEAMHGAGGAPPNHSEAIFWLTKAADLGHPKAQPLIDLLTFVRAEGKDFAASTTTK